jgi:hypothetical protein
MDDNSASRAPPWLTTRARDPSSSRSTRSSLSPTRVGLVVDTDRACGGCSPAEIRSDNEIEVLGRQALGQPLHLLAARRRESGIRMSLPDTGDVRGGFAVPDESDLDAHRPAFLR